MLGKTASLTLKAAALAGISAIAMAASAAMAQSEAPRAQAAFAPEEIIVTARKRQESILKAPVVMTAISASQIENMKITTMNDLAIITPGLFINNDSFSTVGAGVFLRGIGNGESISHGDQSVLLNIDGASMAHGGFYRIGMFDVAQVEVLKGPQALFFGKSSSAGIIAVTSADPTPEWEAKATVGYEFNADELVTTGYVAGPLTDKFGIRIAGYHNDMKGWLYSDNPNVRHKRFGSEDNGGRLTLKYDDKDAGLTVKLKVAHLSRYSDATSGSQDQGVCTGATRQKAQFKYENCKLDNRSGSPDDFKAYNGNIDWSPNGGTFGTAALSLNSPVAVFGNGTPFSKSKGTTAALNIDYELIDGLTVTSVTAYSYLRATEALRSHIGATAGFDFDLGGYLAQQDYSQEVRLTSDWKDSWINFIVGGLYNPNIMKDQIAISLPSYTYFTDDDWKYKSKVYSAFGQVILTPVDKWELTAGVRFTDVTKDFTKVNNMNNIPSAIAPFFGNAFGNTQGNQLPFIPRSASHYHEKDWSPEFTLSWRPTDELTAFVSYKHGYKGPAYYVGTASTGYRPGDLVPFPGEQVKGVEGGIKTLLMDRRLNVNLSAYTYKYNNLQVASVSTVGNVVIVNSADAKVYGAELSASYQPENVEGLTLNGAVNYNHGNYTRFPTSACWGNQTVAEGCVGGQQNLGGKQLGRAPRWTGRVGFDYQTAINDKYAAAFNTNLSFTSGTNVVPEQNPNGYQKGYALLDATIRFGELDGPWELAVIGRNLTNKYYMISGVDDGIPVDIANAGIRGDIQAYVGRTRQVMLQLTVRPEL